MRQTRRRTCLAGALVLAFARASLAAGAAAEGAVRIERLADGFRLLRNGEPYFVKGGGGVDTAFLMDQLVAAGGNSIRTWSIREDSQPFLDMAQARGLTVSPTLWMGQDNNTPTSKQFDYAEAARVEALCDRARQAVLRFKGHPALLVWGVGNEMEHGGGGSPELWKTVEKIAAMIHQIDPDHPTMTVIADLGREGEKVKRIMQYCPSLDILGVNSYGGAVSLARRLAATGWDRPYIVTEFGANYLNLKTTPWGAKLEPPTTQRAAKLPEIYKASIAPGHPACLGSYVFVWKQPAQWPGFHNCFTPAGERLGHVEAMTLAWTGQARQNRCPDIQPIASEAAGREVSPGAPISAAVSAADPEGDALRARWEIRAEERGKSKSKPSFDRLIQSGEAAESNGVFPMAFAAPLEPGAYRLFVTVADGAGNAAGGNMPFHAGAFASQEQKGSSKTGAGP